MPVITSAHRRLATLADVLLRRVVPRVTAEATCGMHSKACCTTNFRTGVQRLDVYGNACGGCVQIYANRCWE